VEILLCAIGSFMAVLIGVHIFRRHVLDYALLRNFGVALPAYSRAKPNGGVRQRKASPRASSRAMIEAAAPDEKSL